MNRFVLILLFLSGSFLMFMSFYDPDSALNLLIGAGIGAVIGMLVQDALINKYQNRGFDAAVDMFNKANANNKANPASLLKEFRLSEQQLDKKIRESIPAEPKHNPGIKFNTEEEFNQAVEMTGFDN